MFHGWASPSRRVRENLVFPENPSVRIRPSARNRREIVCSIELSFQLATSNDSPFGGWAPRDQLRIGTGLCITRLTRQRVVCQFPAPPSNTYCQSPLVRPLIYLEFRS